MMLEACLGLTLDAEREEILIEQPALPEGIDWLEVRNLHVGTKTVSLTFSRIGGKVVASADKSDVRVATVL